MITEDFLSTDSWLEIDKRANGTFVFIAGIKVNDILAKVGSESSDSQGFILRKDIDSFKSPEKIFIKNLYPNKTAQIQIVRD